MTLGLFGVCVTSNVWSRPGDDGGDVGVEWHDLEKQVVDGGEEEKGELRGGVVMMENSSWSEERKDAGVEGRERQQDEDE